jgi:hypothetical protein
MVIGGKIPFLKSITCFNDFFIAQEQKISKIYKTDKKKF